jgi:uroporphyrinogen decarboxylase
MNDRQRTLAILNYQSYDRMPVVHFGFWDETLDLWAQQGYLTGREARSWADGNHVDEAIGRRLGFDYNWSSNFDPGIGLRPAIEPRIIQELPDGSRKEINEDGAIVLLKPGAQGIPQELDHMLKGRSEWEEFFKPRLTHSMDRITRSMVMTTGGAIEFYEGGLEYMQKSHWEKPFGLFCGSLYGKIRNWLGLVNSAYLQVDDPLLFDEMIDTVGELSYQCIKTVINMGVKLDTGHFWEDICFNKGPLINPKVFREKVGPQYSRITALLRDAGINLVSVDCDGKIDDLIPIWLDNGVNVMFPIEVGTWQASIKPWRKEYGRELRGVGGMDKRVFAHDYPAIDAEIERLKPLVDLGGYIPCPDHRLAPDAKWENVQYYCDVMQGAFA